MVAAIHELPKRTPIKEVLDDYYNLVRNLAKPLSHPNPVLDYFRRKLTLRSLTVLSHLISVLVTSFDELTKSPSSAATATAKGSPQ